MSNEEYEKAVRNEDNARIISAAVDGYRGLIDAHDLESLKNVSLWRALQKYNPDKHMKWTTYLYAYVNWRCRAYLYSKRNSKKNIKTINFEDGFVEKTYSLPKENFDEITECLCDEDKKLLKYKFVDKMTLAEIGAIYGYTVERVRQKLTKIYKILREQND